MASGRVNSVRPHRSRSLVLSTSSDKTARIWDCDKKVIYLSDSNSGSSSKQILPYYLNSIVLGSSPKSKI